ncbi:hypothetical protein Nepgr_032593 [Nepenthes gracilis]|uniref:Uncharacterized protein n=1 Tax=Nepenthes gracilis TaxID=150966 RepID=A0AAD3Y7T1_NEPGR|nr:hypothetical protein Nepgr_032593 [Nepenthes gracilis]
MRQSHRPPQPLKQPKVSKEDETKANFRITPNSTPSKSASIPKNATTGDPKEESSQQIIVTKEQPKARAPASSQEANFHSEVLDALCLDTLESVWFVCCIRFLSLPGGEKMCSDAAVLDEHLGVSLVGLNLHPVLAGLYPEVFASPDAGTSVKKVDSPPVSGVIALDDGIWISRHVVLPMLNALHEGWYLQWLPI